MKSSRVVLGMAVSAMLLGACTSDEPTVSEPPTDEINDSQDPDDTVAPEADADTHDAPAAQGPPPPVEGSATVTSVNYAFAIPELTAGDTLAMTNEAADEVHELVAIKVADDDTRTDSELIEAWPAHFEALRTTGTSEDPLGGDVDVVLVAAPSAAAFLAEGDNAVSEGRYLFVCALPINGDPAMLLAPPAEAGPPAHFAVDGPRHYDEGMISVVTVGPAA